LFIKIANSIHVELLIEDIAKILRIEFWFIPKIEFIEIRIIKKIKFLSIFRYEIKINGEIFCQVIINKHENQFNPSIIEGSHKWKGINLNFINNGKIIRILLLFIKKKFLLIKKINNKIEAKAWIKKYFIVASIE
jgi:hypothetical protein